MPFQTLRGAPESHASSRSNGGPSRAQAGTRFLVFAALVACVLCLPSRALAGPSADTPPFAVRMIKLGGEPGEKAVREHLKFARAAGFNAVWIYSGSAGRWVERDAPDGPFLFPAFLETARWCRTHGMRIAVSVNPIANAYGAFIFSDPGGEERIRKFFELLWRQAGVRDLVISLDDQPYLLSDLQDVGRYGLDAGPAHLDLLRRLERSAPEGARLWFCPTVYCDKHLGDGTWSYARSFLAGLAGLPKRIGIVWTGTEVISKSITAVDLAATRARLGGREILLYDNYPANDDGKREALGLILGPLRHRGAGLAKETAIYLACPMTELGASRLPLLTTADYLADPGGYDPEASWRRAIERLAGPDRAARDALAAQASEWGAWVGEPDHMHSYEQNEETAADESHRPAARTRWAEVVRVYPERMKALANVADTAFRDDLLEVMERRLSVARRYAGGSSSVPSLIPSNRMVDK